MLSQTADPVLQAKRRAKDYWNVDGLPTLVIGVFFLLPLVIPHTPDWLSERLWFAFWVLAIVESQNHEIVLWLKERLTYPRTGYVAPPESKPVSPFIQLSLNQEPAHEEPPYISRFSLRTVIITGLLLAPVLIWSMVFMERWLEAAFFILLGAIRLKAISKNKLVWIDVFGFILTGLAIATQVLSGSLLLFLAPGTLFTLRGGIMLLRYLHRNPQPQS